MFGGFQLEKASGYSPELTLDQSMAPRGRGTKQNQLQHNQSKATSSLFLSNMIDKFDKCL